MPKTYVWTVTIKYALPMFPGEPALAQPGTLIFAGPGQFTPLQLVLHLKDLATKLPFSRYQMVRDQLAKLSELAAKIRPEQLMGNLNPDHGEDVLLSNDAMPRLPTDALGYDWVRTAIDWPLIGTIDYLGQQLEMSITRQVGEAVTP